jgi:vacuolar protein sorting-associated protein 52
MIRLNDAIYAAAIGQGNCPATLMDSHLVSMRLALWPAFQKGLGAHVDAIKKLSSTSSGSMFGAKTLLKDATVQAVRTSISPSVLR